MRKLDIAKAKIHQIPVKYKVWSETFKRFIWRVVYIQEFYFSKNNSNCEDWILISPIPNSRLYGEYIDPDILIF